MISMKSRANATVFASFLLVCAIGVSAYRGTELASPLHARLANPTDALSEVIKTPYRPARFGATPQPPTEIHCHIRVNQVGYAIHDPRFATLMSNVDESGHLFEVIASRTRNVSLVVEPTVQERSWNKRYRFTYRLPLDGILVPGRYFIRSISQPSCVSPSFVIGSSVSVYAQSLNNALFFFQTQRDGPDVPLNALRPQPTHLTDFNALIYDTPRSTGQTGADDQTLASRLVPIGGPIDVSGGWFDAGDYLKFVETASFNTCMLLIAARDGNGLTVQNRQSLAAESRFGLNWLLKMWDDKTRTLYYQVGIGDGDVAHLLGDHDLWRLPEADDALNVKPGDPKYFLKYRPVFRAGPPGSGISPNLAGRVSAAFALGSQLFKHTDPKFAARCLQCAIHVYALARTKNVGQLTTATDYNYYPETEWRDDMEFGAVELSRAMPKTHDARYQMYLHDAARWAKGYIAAPESGVDTLNLYDVSALADFELVNQLRLQSSDDSYDVTGDDLIQDIRNHLSDASAASKNAFGLGVKLSDGDDPTAHALGLAIEADLYRKLTGDSTYRSFGSAQRDWVLGNNAWGTSFMVGSGTEYPKSLHDQIANLRPSAVLRGAVVTGPESREELRDDKPQAMIGMIRPAAENDIYAQYSTKSVQYVDDVADSDTVEPCSDCTALAIVLFATQPRR